MMAFKALADIWFLETGLDKKVTAKTQYTLFFWSSNMQEKGYLTITFVYHPNASTYTF